MTQVEEQQQSGNYTLEGINSTIRLGKNHTLKLEYARSESRAEPKYVSTDGGLSWGISESIFPLQIAINLAMLFHYVVAETIMMVEPVSIIMLVIYLEISPLVEIIINVVRGQRALISVNV